MRCVIDAVRRGEPELARERGASLVGLAAGARHALRAHLEPNHLELNPLEPARFEQAI